MLGVDNLIRAMQQNLQERCISSDTAMATTHKDLFPLTIMHKQHHVALIIPHHTQNRTCLTSLVMFSGSRQAQIT